MADFILARVLRGVAAALINEANSLIAEAVRLERVEPPAANTDPILPHE